MKRHHATSRRRAFARERKRFVADVKTFLDRYQIPHDRPLDISAEEEGSAPQGRDGQPAS